MTKLYFIILTLFSCSVLAESTVTNNENLPKETAITEGIQTTETVTTGKDGKVISSSKSKTLTTQKTVVKDNYTEHQKLTMKQKTESTSRPIVEDDYLRNRKQNCYKSFEEGNGHLRRYCKLLGWKLEKEIRAEMAKEGKY